MPFEDGMVQMKWMGRNSFRDHLCWCPDNVQQQDNKIACCWFISHPLSGTSYIISPFQFQVIQEPWVFQRIFHSWFRIFIFWIFNFTMLYTLMTVSNTLCWCRWYWLTSTMRVHLCKQYHCPCFIDTILFCTNPSVGDTQHISSYSVDAIIQHFHNDTDHIVDEWCYHQYQHYTNGRGWVIYQFV